MNVKNLTKAPFSSPWIFRHHLGRSKTILDIGCGDGSLMRKINYDKKYLVTGVELHKPSLKRAKLTGVYKQIICSDVRKIAFKAKSFDVVFASQVIEHLSKKDALSLIQKMERIARTKVIIATPNGFVKYDPFEGHDGNSLQEHKSGWEVKEMEMKGYKIYGQGISFIYKPSGLLYKYRRLKDILTVIAYFLAPWAYFIPFASACIIAIKAKRDV